MVSNGGLCEVICDVPCTPSCGINIVLAIGSRRSGIMLSHQSAESAPTEIKLSRLAPCVDNSAVSRFVDSVIFGIQKHKFAGQGPSEPHSRNKIPQTWTPGFFAVLCRWVRISVTIFVNNEMNYRTRTCMSTDTTVYLTSKTRNTYTWIRYSIQ